MDTSPWTWPIAHYRRPGDNPDSIQNDRGAAGNVLVIEARGYTLDETLKQNGCEDLDEA